MAASNSAEVEKLALGAGMKKGGAAKGELVLAMYELANCFRNGWGIKKDPAAAKQYYETAANLGDTDAMNEVAWCYTEGFGTKKDKVSKICRLSSLPVLHFGEGVRQVHRSMSTRLSVYAIATRTVCLGKRTASISAITRDVH
jgi:TPR repeat protein